LTKFATPHHKNITNPWDWATTLIARTFVFTIIAYIFISGASLKIRMCNWRLQIEWNKRTGAARHMQSSFSCRCRCSNFKPLIWRFYSSFFAPFNPTTQNPWLNKPTFELSCQPRIFTSARAFRTVQTQFLAALDDCSAK